MATEERPPYPGRRRASSGVMDKGLKKGAIGYVSNIVIGVASTAPGVLARHDARLHRRRSRASACTRPAVMLVAFIPMLLVARRPTNTSTAPTPTPARRSRGRRARSAR